jgi:hypothetical protein
MKHKVFLVGIIGIMLGFGNCSVDHQNLVDDQDIDDLIIIQNNVHSLSKSFNMGYPVYGIDLLGYTKPLLMRDLTHSDNFISSASYNVFLEDAALNKKGNEYTITLLLTTGISRTARLKAKFKSFPYAGKNVLVYLSLYDFSAGKIEELDYKGNEQMLERLIVRYIELMGMFYNKSRLLS